MTKQDTAATRPVRDRITLITGASRGIGAACAHRLAAAGHAVCVNYARDEKTARALVESLRRGGTRAIAVQADVARESDVVRLFETCDRELGPLTGLVNNAGQLAPPARVDAMSADRISQLLAVNVVGAFIAAREAVRRLSTRHGGAGGTIVNVSSAAARLGSPGEFVDYAASKGAIDAMTRGLSLEVAAEGVRVVGVRPGLIDTEIHDSFGAVGRLGRLAPSVPVGRAGSADEVAAVIAWLLSDDASYMTGATLDVTGGR